MIAQKINQQISRFNFAPTFGLKQRLARFSSGRHFFLRDATPRRRPLIPCHLRCRRNRADRATRDGFDGLDTGDRRGNGYVRLVLLLRPFVTPTVYDTVRRVQGVVPWQVSVRVHVGICVEARAWRATSVLPRFSADGPLENLSCGIIPASARVRRRDAISRVVSRRGLCFY